VLNELAISIAVNIALGVVLLTLLRRKRTRDTLANVGVSVGSIFFWGVLSWILYGGVTFAYAHRIFDIPFTWWSFVLAFVLDDLRYYWWHRIGHRSRWFWASHGLHHSSQHFNLSTNLRQSWTSEFSGLILLNVPLALIGFHPGVIALAFWANLLYQFWIHAEMIDRLPRWFEWLLNTPSHHRVHHASNPRYLYSNYAGVLMIWDRLFGTYNPVRIALHEYFGIARDMLQRNLTTKQRMAYLLAPPGWSHDGSRGTTAILRAAELARRRRICTSAEAPPDAISQRLAASSR